VKTVVGLLAVMANALLLEGLSKAFGGNRVLRAVDLRVKGGEIHALVGENGSGKSTLVKVLSGYHAPDRLACAQVNGVDVRLPLPAGAAARAGLAFVHQDLALIESASVLENLFLGSLETKLGWRVPWRHEVLRANNVLARFGLGSVDPLQVMERLDGAERAMVAVARAVTALDRAERPGSGQASRGVLVVDEVTAYLPEDAVRRVLGTFRSTADLGFGVLFVTHRLEEVFSTADSVTVLRDGAVVHSSSVKAVTRQELVSLMVGRDLDEEAEVGAREVGAVGGEQAALVIENLEAGAVTDVSIRVLPGEVVGLTGLVGSGFESIPYALFGAAPANGRIRIGRQRASLRGWTPRRAMRAGLALVPAGRLTRGAVGTATVGENMLLLSARRLWRHGFISPAAERAAAESLMRQFDIRPPLSDIELGRLSGGNQQKAILAKWLTSGASAFLIHEPTQGVDVGAKGQILGTIRGLGNAGKALLVASADQVDLARVCDRVVVFREGRIHSELSGSGITEARISAAAHGIDAIKVKA